MKKLFLFLITFWCIILNNSNIPEYMPTFKYLNILNLSNNIRVLEFFLFVVLYFFILISNKTVNNLKLQLLLLIFILLGILNPSFSSNISIEKFYDLYLRISPFIVFIIASQIKIDFKDIIKIIKINFLFLLISIIIALIIQVPIFYRPYLDPSSGDYVHGIYSDSHLFGTFLTIGSISYFYKYMEKKKKNFIIYSISLFLISILSANEKMIILNLALLPIIFFYFKLRHKKKTNLFRNIIFAIFLITILIYISNYIINEGFLRINQLINYSIEDFGPVTAWLLTFYLITQSLSNFLFGVGVGEYGWFGALLSLSNNNLTKYNMLFYDEFLSNSILSGAFAFKTNTWSSLLAEFGIIGLFCFIIILVIVIKNVPINKIEHPDDEFIAVLFYLILISVIYQGFFTPYTNWSEATLTFPMMTIAAYFQNNHIEKKSIYPLEKF